MKRAIIYLLLIISACNDKPVSNEDREAIKKGIEARTPVKVTEAQIITIAYDEAREDLRDTVVTKYLWKTFYVKPADSLLAELWLAYEFANNKNQNLADNVQLFEDMVIYTKPIIKNDSLSRLLVAYLPKKEIVMKITSQ